MGIFNTVGNGVTKAIDFMVEKNRKIALMNRVKMVIRNEQNNADRAYIALGKYYFRNLRDEENSETEPYCAAAEKAINRRDRALLKLDELTSPCDCRCDDADEDECEECDSDCTGCPYSDGDDADDTAAFATEDEDQEETVSEFPHPELVWQDTDETAEETVEPKEPEESDKDQAVGMLWQPEEVKTDAPVGEAADDTFSSTIPTEKF